MTCKKCGLYFCIHSNAQDRFKDKHTSSLPIGSRGVIGGKTYEVFGFIVKRERRNRYKWREYFLFNPHHGIAFLSEYDGNWNFLRPYANHPWVLGTTESPVIKGDSFLLYARFRADVIYAEGEFFIDVIETTESCEHWEHIFPPQILTYEQNQTLCSSYLGEYIDAREVAKAFKLSQSQLPPKKSFGYTQPIFRNVSKKSLATVTLGSLALLIIITFLFNSNAKDKNIFHARYTQVDTATQKLFVTGSFAVEETKNLVLNVNAPLSNDWFFAEYVLVNDITGEELTFTNEVEYYHGYTDGESWEEGSKTSEIFLSRIPPGKYHFNIYPQFSMLNKQFEVAVFHDAPFYSNFWLMVFGILLYPVGYYLYYRRMEVRRWEDSSYSPYSQ